MKLKDLKIIKVSHIKIGLLLGFIIGAIFVTHALSCPLPIGNEINEGIMCSDKAVGAILHYPFLMSMIMVGIPLQIIFQFDILDSDVIMNILIWTFGTGLYTVAGGLFGWIVEKLQYLLKRPSAK